MFRKHIKAGDTYRVTLRQKICMHYGTEVKSVIGKATVSEHEIRSIVDSTTLYHGWVLCIATTSYGTVFIDGNDVVAIVRIPDITLPEEELSDGE